MKRLACFFLFFSLFFSAQSQKKYPALLWKISGNGLKKPSYLYGTMHVSNRVAYYLSEQFFDALKKVEVVGLETNPGEWLENMEGTGELGELSRISENAPRDFYKSAFTISFPERRMLQGILSYDPDIINGLLYRQNRAKENFEESTYIDLFIFQTASKLNKQVISLENFAQSEIKARLSAMPDEETNEEGNPNNYYTNTQKIEDAYREGNLDMIDSLSKLSSSKNMQKYLIRDRNVFFVNTIDSVLKTKTLFSGVGAAHLPGEEGVIELLRKKGYQVEPIIPLVSKKSHNMREELDLQVKPVTYQKQFVSDSAFSVNVPGKLYTIVNLGNIKYYIYPDMVNGNFYTVVRLKYLGPVFGITPAQLQQRMDSLLFEHIPGKIIERKEITAGNGIKGIEVVNRTRRGDEQHYQIFFTELELILFKLGGKGNYAGSNDAKQFFNSIQFIEKPSSVVSFAPPSKGFSVKIPGNYSYVKYDGGAVSGAVEDLFAYDKTKQQGVGVRQAVFNDFTYLEADTFELNQFAKNILKNYGFKGKAEKPVIELGFPCIRFSGKNGFSNLYGKLYIKGVHYYYVYHFSASESGFDTEFFNSFSLTDFDYLNPIKEITDKDFYFKAKDEVTDNALSRFTEAYVKEYEATRTNTDSLKKYFDFRSSTKYYYSPSSNEYINITYEKYNDYDYRDAATIDDKISDAFVNLTTARVTNKKMDNRNGTRSFSFVLKDTATARAIAVKIVFKNGMMYEISAPYDTTLGLRGWTKSFMQSFTPLDTVIGMNIFENKFPRLLHDLSSMDTTTRQMANASVRSISMHKTFAPAFVKFVSGNDINKVSEESRAQLFVNGGTMQNEKIVAPYKILYKQYTDSFYMQLCLLKGLACLKTQGSYQTFYTLLKAETPLVGEEATVNDVFSMLHDSLELCRNFFPGILSLTRFDEYRNPVYALLAELVNRKLISPQIYASQKENILMDANLALKRYSPGTARAGEGLEYLEKNAREIAETIKGNLEGLATNNFYRNSPYLKAMEAYNRHHLVNYAYALSPFYKTDEKTRQYFSKLSTIKSQNIAMPVAINLLKQDVHLNDTLVSFYSRNRYTRAFFYSELEKEGLTAKFDKQYLNQESIIESVLSSQKQLNSYYNYDKDKMKKDTLILVAQTRAKNKYQEGNMYIYKNMKARNEEEQWSAVFVSAGEKPITSRIELVNANFYIDKSKTEEENINDLLNGFYLQYRKRAAPSGNSHE